MATTTVTPLPALKDVAHAQSNELFNVLALIDAVQRDLPHTNEMEMNDRLLQMARMKIEAVQHALDPYI